MRLTNYLFHNNQKWLFKTMWKNSKSKYKEGILNKPLYFENSDIPILDPAEVIKPAKKFPVWIPPIYDDILFKEPVPEDLRFENIYEFNPKCQLVEGERQALILTKTQAFHNLPLKIENLIDKEIIKNQDLLVQRAIMESNVWDATKEKLPRRYNPELPGWKFKAEFGIPDYKIATLTLKALLKICQSLCAKNPQLFYERKLVYDELFSSWFYFKEKLLSINGVIDATFYTNKELLPFADDKMINDTKEYKLPDIFPLEATIDFNIKRQLKDSIISLGDMIIETVYPHPHTIFMCYDGKWSASQLNAKGLIFSYAHALRLFRRKYGDQLIDLPTPITTQCVVTNGNTFTFICFQLNTLDENNLTKNIVWFDSDNKLFNKILPKRAMLRNTKYEDYDPLVFKKFLAIYINGLH